MVPRSVLLASSVLGLMISYIGPSTAIAASCSEIVEGGRLGPPDWASSWPYGDACYIDFPGGYAKEREFYGSKCRALDGFVHFSPDHGSGKNTCVYRPTAPKTEIIPTPGPRRTPDIQSQPPAYDPPPLSNSPTKVDCSLNKQASEDKIRKYNNASAAGDYRIVTIVAEELMSELSRSPTQCNESIKPALVKLNCMKSVSETLLATEDFEVAIAGVAVKNFCSDKYTNAHVEKAKQKIDYHMSKTSSSARNKPNSIIKDPNKKNDEYYAAYAHTLSTQYYGISWWAKSEKEAADEALKMCRSSYENSVSASKRKDNCYLIHTVFQGCISFAISRSGRWGSGAGKDGWVSNQVAREACNAYGCEVENQRKVCSFGSDSTLIVDGTPTSKKSGIVFE